MKTYFWYTLILPVFFFFTFFPVSATSLVDGYKGSFKLDDVVVTVENLNVRFCASLSCRVLGNQAINTTGTLIGGPETDGVYIWWKIHYLNGIDGWGAENFLKKQTGLSTIQQSTPITVPSGTMLARTLRLSSTGDDVVILQKFLSTYDNVYPSKNITGYYGNLTSAAVSAFQKLNGFIPTGTVGPFTREKINSLLPKSSLTTTNTTSTIPATNAISSGLSNGMGIVSTVVSPTRVDLSWGGITGVADYAIYRDGKQLNTTTGTTYSDTTASPGAYTYVVKGVGGSPNGASYSVLVFNHGDVYTFPVGDITAPSSPSNLIVTPNLNGGVFLTWGSSSDGVGVIGYKIYRNGKMINYSSVNSYNDIVIPVSGIFYTYAVAAFDFSTNESIKSNEVTIMVYRHDADAPSIPTGLLVQMNGSTQVTLSWNASTDNRGVTGYGIYRGGVKIATATGTSYSDTGLASGMVYLYTVTAFDAVGNESGQSVQVATADTTPPSNPVWGSGTPISGTQVNLSWSGSYDNVGIAGYGIYRGGVKIATVTGTSYSDTGLADGTTYTYTLTAFDATGNESVKSSPLTVGTIDTLPPSAPTWKSAIAVSGTQIDLSWNVSTDPSAWYYKVYRSGAYLAVTSGLSFSDTGLTQNTTYVYTVTVFDYSGHESAQSSPMSVVAKIGSTPVSTPAPTPTPVTTPVTTPTPILDTTPPTAPSITWHNGLVANTIKFGWSAATDNVGVAWYTIYRDGVQITNVPSSALSYTDTGLKSKTTYWHGVEAYDAAGNKSIKSETVTTTK